MRFLAPALLVALAVGLSAAGPSRATYPASQQRLLILSEASGFASLELLGPQKQRLDLDVPIGVLGSAAISADGTQIAINASVPLDPTDPTSAALSAGMRDLRPHVSHSDPCPRCQPVAAWEPG